MSTAAQWDRVFERLDALPPAPHILPKLLRVLAEPEVDVQQVTDLITFDPGLAAKVLQLCNSAWMASATPVADVAEAVSRLGLRCIYRLVAAVHGRVALRPSRPVAHFDPARLWKHSVITALAAQFLAKDRALEESTVFTAALLHDAGQVVFAQALGDRYGVLWRPGPNGFPVSEPVAQERAAWGTDHAQVGGRLLIHWQFPEPIAAGVAHHHQPDQAGSWAALAACVNLGEALALAIEGPPDSPVILQQNGAAEALRLLQLSPDQLLRYRYLTLENFEFVNALCRL